MKTIHISHPHTLNQKDQVPSVMALGYFDGVHLGHQKVIDEAKSIAKKEGLALAVMISSASITCFAKGTGTKRLNYTA